MARSSTLCSTGGCADGEFGYPAGSCDPGVSSGAQPGQSQPENAGLAPGSFGLLATLFAPPRNPVYPGGDPGQDTKLDQMVARDARALGALRAVETILTYARSARAFC